MKLLAGILVVHITVLFASAENLSNNRFMKLGEISKHALNSHKVLNRVDGDRIHEVVFSVKQTNLDQISQILWDVSNPRSTNYGKHLTKQKVLEITRNAEGKDVVRDYLKSIGAEIVQEQKDGHYITAQAKISVWEGAFSTEFFEFELYHNSKSLNKLDKQIRALSYSLPENVASHVSAVYKTTQFPSPVSTHLIFRDIGSAAEFSLEELAEQSYVTPAFLKTHYSISNNTGNYLTSQAIYSSLNQTISPNDLSVFQTKFSLPVEDLYKSIDGHVDDVTCIESPNDCGEANLDVQYMMSTAQNVPTTSYYVDDSVSWAEWAAGVADMDDPPKVFSISYSSYEESVDDSEKEAFDTEMQQLGVMGVTVLSASGDDGVAGFAVRGDLDLCGYYPQFPAASPYITAVGGTAGPESGSEEVAAQANKNSLITSGGGTSSLYPVQDWQKDHVKGYFSKVKGTDKAPVKGYTSGSRGYPDISLLAHAYIVVIGGNFTEVDGTSASTPVMAGLVSLVNSRRKAAGKSTLGWLNPALYEYSDDFAVDITSGDNKCLADAEECCEQGFYAAEGWDPVTGLGVLNYDNFLDSMMSVGSDDSSSDDDETLSDGAIAGIVIGSVVGAGLLVGVGVYVATQSSAAGSVAVVSKDAAQPTNNSKSGDVSHSPLTQKTPAKENELV